MREFDITINKVITTGCELWVNSTVHENTPGVMYFEFLEGPGLNTIMTQKTSTFEELNTYKQQLNDDGLFMYYCLQIKTKETVLSGNIEHKPEEEYLSLRVYCDFVDNKWILYNGLQEVKTNDDLNLIFTNKTEYDAGLVTKPIFSICRLHNCLETKLRSYIFDTLKTCGQYPECNKDSYGDHIRNFLFSTIFILRQLICQERYAEATRILDSINNCNGICEDTRSNSNKCNCCN